jgi:hypothetical protein
VKESGQGQTNAERGYRKVVRVQEVENFRGLVCVWEVLGEDRSLRLFMLDSFLFFIS